MSTTGVALYDQLVRGYEDPSGQEYPGLRPLRAEAFGSFREHGFPTIKDEDWRFTNMAPFLKEAYAFVAPLLKDRAGLPALVRQGCVEGWDAWQAVLVDGHLDLSLSNLPEASEMLVCALREVMGSEAYAQRTGLHADWKQHPFAALNTAFFRDGLYVEVKPGKRPSKPLHVLHVYTEGGAFLQPRHYIRLNARAELTLLESTVSADNGSTPRFVNAVTEAGLSDGARLTHYVLQGGRKSDRWVNHTQVSQAAHSYYDNITLSLPAPELNRNQLQVALDGQGCECHLYGLYLPGDDQLVDHHTVVDHRFPNCESNELYKGVLNGNGKAVFNGKIFVRQQAQKTNAFQQNNNLLLGEKAQVHSKPQLEIFADDVKCSHGSTIGQFDPDSLFYLRARGIGEELARELLVQAFGADITGRIAIGPVQRHVEKHLMSKPVVQTRDVPHIEHI